MGMVTSSNENSYLVIWRKMVISGQSGIGWDDRVNLYSFLTISFQFPLALEWSKKVNPLVKSVYIPNGVDTNKFKPEGEKISIDLKNQLFFVSER